LILDVQSLAAVALAAQAVERAQIAAPVPRSQGRPGGPAAITSVGDRRIAVPLEEWSPARGVLGRQDRARRQPRGRPVRGQSCRCPLAHLLRAYPPRTHLGAVVVYSERGRSVAFAVKKIVDIVEDSLDTRSDLETPGSRLGGHPAAGPEMLDVRQAILAADLHFFDAIEAMEDA